MKHRRGWARPIGVKSFLKPACDAARCLSNRRPNANPALIYDIDGLRRNRRRFWSSCQGREERLQSPLEIATASLQIRRAMATQVFRNIHGYRIILSAAGNLFREPANRK